MTESVGKSKTLHKAIASKDWSTIRRLAESLNIRYEFSNSLIQHLKGIPRDLVTDIERKISPSAIDDQYNGTTALYKSAFDGYTDVCRILIESGANKDIQNVNGATALYARSQNGHTDTCQLLNRTGQSGAEKDIQMKDGSTALFISAQKGNTDICKLLIQSGANKDIQTKDGTTALYISAEKGYTDICKLLIQSGANTDIQREDGATALYISAQEGHTDICKLLIQSGANMDLQMKDGTTALYISAQNGHTDACRLLIQSGANKDIQEEFGLTALYVSAQKGHTDICKLLIQSGANKDLQMKDGETALQISTQNGHTDICKLLIQSGANKDIQKEDGWTAMMFAACFNRYDIVKLLIRNGANSDLQNSSGDTALHLAAYYGHSSVVKLLLDTGASILYSKKGNTPLHACFLNQGLSYNHHRNVIVAFMKTDPNIASIQNNDDKTVIDLYEECECRRYETERGCLQKKELLLILKGGQLPVIDFSPSESTIPSIIQTQGPSSVKTYTEALEEGAVEVNLGMIKVIGQERAGKTCLINSCLGKKFNQDEEITDGIATTKIILTRTTNKTEEWSENLTDSVGSATEIYERSLAETISMKAVENCGSVGKILGDYCKSVDEESLEKGKTIHETPNENLQVTCAITNTDLQQNKGPPLSIRKEIVKCFKEGRYIPKELVKWHRIGKDTFNIWDYGGQVIYHGIHRIFMTSMAVYIVVFNLNVNLDAKAVVMDSSGQYHTHHLTNLEFILYWISSVYVHCRELKVDMKLEIALPAIVLVGTHRDSLGSTEQERISKVKETFEKIRNALMGKPYEKHVYPTYFDIENDRSEIDGNIAKLKTVVEDLMTALYKPIPLKWMRFRSELQKLKDALLVCPLKEVKELAAKLGINDENQQSVLLNFLYDIGEIIYMPDNKVLQNHVVLDPMRYVEIATTVITVKQPSLPPALYTEFYRKLDKGILEEPLLKKLLSDRGVDLKKFEFFVELMGRFCLLCERKAAKRGHRSFFVPLRLALEPSSDKHRRVDNYGNRAISIYHDFCGYLPDELFPQVVTEFIDSFQDKEGNEQPVLARDHAELYFDQHHSVIMSAVTFGQNRLLRTTILRRKPYDGAQKNLEPSPEACKTVLDFLEKSFKVSQEGGRRGFQFQRCIPCSICSKNSPNKHILWLGNFEKEGLPCKDEVMSVVRYKRLFAYTVDSGERLREEPYAEGSGLEESDFRWMLLRVSDNIGDDLNKWKVALSDHINAAALHKATDALSLFESLIDKEHIKNDDIRILLETIKMTGSLHLRKHIPKYPSLDNITHFSPFRQSVIAFGEKLTDDYNRKIVFYYGLRRQYSDGWSLILDLQQRLILDNTVKSLDDFKSKLNGMGLESLSRCLTC